MAQLNIAIIGAGPAGCILARLLNHPSINITIYEADSSPDSRSQGGTLDLHEQTGLAALQKAGLYDEFLRHARFDGEALLLCDKRLKGYLQFSRGSAEHSRGSPEIDRVVLRRLLLESLPPGLIRWGYKLRSVSEGNVLHFDQGVESGFDLVIGADGVWSRVRRFITPDQPYDSKVSCQLFRIPDAARTAPAADALVNRGSLYAYSDGKSIMGQQLGDGSIQVYAWTTGSREEEPEETDEETIRNRVRDQFSDWAPELRDLLEQATERTDARRIYTLPVGFKWPHKPGVTLIGDAAHVMPPFAGEGVNLAFGDAMKLADEIRSFVGNDKVVLDDVLRGYEEDLFRRAGLAQELSVGIMQDMFFTPGAPRTVIEKYMMRMVKFRTSPRVYSAAYPLIAAGVYSYYLGFKLFR
ncbi:hypothetical protein BDV25DRAFT_151701 [Aspergillus avenaceus]|uniref:FAD-binding domain-containing protein n=1 Tax=Aspergillus avenaceus TaxID=36643 RepID=A0A5N6U0D1_ASPAV|nr:hypothetical protein BDV25DRAFT_151701 [Aspergillus avenaceus]